MQPVIHNPILTGFNPDPCIIRVDQDYYIVTSTFEWFPGVPVYHSKDLCNWRHLGNILTEVNFSGNPDSCSIWAPALSYHEGIYYLVYTDVRRSKFPFKDAHNYLITASDIMGPWSEPIYLNSGNFDPSLFHDEDGKKWLLNVHWDYRIEGRNKSVGIVMQEFSAEKNKLVGPIFKVFDGTVLRKTEAPHLYRHNDFYYLVTAEGGTGRTHAVTIVRSKDIIGPYEVDPQNPMLTSANNHELMLQKAGHASLVCTQNEEWYIAHLCSRPIDGNYSILGRETALQRVCWSDDGWLRLACGGNEPEVEVQAPALTPHPFPSDNQDFDDFDNLQLHKCWNTLRMAPKEEWCSLSERKSHLRIRGGESLHSLHEQHLIARRQEDLKCEVETSIEFEPDTFLQMAGLVLYFNTDNYVYFYISRDEVVGKCLQIMQCVKGDFSVCNQVYSIEGSQVCVLKATIEGTMARFFYKTNVKDWTAVKEPISISHLSDEGNGFTGNFVGICVQDMQGTKKHADFDYFSYRRGS
ncbi:glycoside hydrolase family 43 protein [Pradoshia sp. D12]|uniref:glycoside hydrolase family 43 protein n=1 Tax=Bacillaceae TaxID=186817 RepID=UPI00080AF753|nr:MULTISPECIES: glycoside hydrolase family 43 protein [Bacillaceae]OCA90213.1 beta-xylosidase [Bacillus sp. FJAT-27986]QFK73255.1 glycoside hydrolase family 43 protein [Pradoshia sp. D12]TPF73796.1 glycoside hydrolase family 43 protein [Bacillus sp. D12]